LFSAVEFSANLAGLNGYYGKRKSQKIFFLNIAIVYLFSYSTGQPANRKSCFANRSQSRQPIRSRLQLNNQPIRTADHQQRQPIKRRALQNSEE